MAKRKKQDEDSDEDFDPSSVEMTVELSSLDNQVDLLPVRKSYTDEFFYQGPTSNSNSSETIRDIDPNSF